VHSHVRYLSAYGRTHSAREFAKANHFLSNRKVLLRSTLELKRPAESGYKKQTILLEDIKTFFKFVFIKVIILNKKVMHDEQIRISHVPNKLSSHSFWRIFDIFLPEFL
jgi:hypothetical protein